MFSIADQHSILAMLVIILAALNDNVNGDANFGNPVGVRKSTDSRCRPGMVWVERPGGQKGCMKKVLPNQECEFNQQCNSNRAATHSYCGWSTTSNHESPICQCLDGFSITADGFGCVPFRECSLNDFNSAQDRADCGENQFCRKGLCLCVANYGFNLRGECVPLMANGEPIVEHQVQEVDKAKENFEVQLRDGRNRVENLENELRSTKHLVYVLFGLFVSVFVCLLSGLVWMGIRTRRVQVRYASGIELSQRGQNQPQQEQQQPAEAQQALLNGNPQQNA